MNGRPPCDKKDKSGNNMQIKKAISVRSYVFGPHNRYFQLLNASAAATAVLYFLPLPHGHGSFLPIFTRLI